MRTVDVTGGPPTVLVLAEDQEECSFLCKVVGQEYPVMAAGKVEEAIRLLFATRPAAMVLGGPLSVGPSREKLINALRSDSGRRSIPLLLCGHSEIPASGGHGPATVVDTIPPDAFCIREQLRRLIGASVSPESTEPKRWQRDVYIATHWRTRLVKEENRYCGDMPVPVALSHAPM